MIHSVWKPCPKIWARNERWESSKKKTVTCCTACNTQRRPTARPLWPKRRLRDSKYCGACVTKRLNLPRTHPLPDPPPAMRLWDLAALTGTFHHRYMPQLLLLYITHKKKHRNHFEILFCNTWTQNRRKKTAWQGTAIALVEQDTMHLSSEIRPLRAASPVFKTVFPGNNSGSTPSLSRQQEGGGGSFNQHQNARRRRPKTASDAVYDRNGIRMASTQSSQFQSPPQLPNSVTSDTPSVARTREMKRLFKKPTGAYMSAKLWD